MSWIPRFFIIFYLLAGFAGEACAHTIITRTSDRQTVTLSQLASIAGASDLILIGEVHDSKDHHDLQLDVIRSLVAGKLPLAIGLEMISADHQQHLDGWIKGTLSEPEMQEVFEANWSPDWYMYRDIFLFARGNRIPMVALNVPLAIVKKVSQQGFDALTREERKDLPEGTSCDLNNPQIAMLKKTFQQIPHHLQKGKMFSNFCEAQTVRNSGMAVNVARYVEGHPGRKLVGLTGIWHAVKYAIPDQLQRLRSKLSCTVILPETPQLNIGNAGMSEADYLVEL
ncbi:MAG TPA: hypothetical protein DCZ75_04510 [Geobacter sp.]|nr:hypothetical protein [Geobacter sp.]